MKAAPPTAIASRLPENLLDQLSARVLPSKLSHRCGAIKQTRGGRWPTGPVTEEYDFVDIVWHKCEFREAYR
jgi:hypothetical protein